MAPGVMLLTKGVATGLVNAPFVYKLNSGTTTYATCYEAEHLPAGLKLDGDTIVGIPTTSGKTTAIIGAKNIGGKDNKLLTINIVGSTDN